MMMGVKMIKTTIMTEAMIMMLTMVATTVAIVVVPVTLVMMSNICTIESNITL
jgi:hypothetical protein